MKITKRTALVLIASLIFMAAAVWVWFAAKPDPMPLFTNQVDIGILGPIRIEFPEEHAAAAQDVEISIVPGLGTTSLWDGNELAIWFNAPANSGVEYQIGIEVGSVNGSDEANTYEWTFVPRQAEVVYLKQSGLGAELWAVDENGADPRQLTQTNASISDYHISPDGNSILLSVLNAAEGVDIWIVDRSGSNMQQLIACEQKRCTEAVYSPQMDNVLYISKSVNRSNPDAPDRLEMLDISTGQTSVIYEHQGTGLKDLRISPDGKWIAFLDAESGIILLNNLETGKLQSLNCGTSENASFSPSSQRMIFPCAEEGDPDPCKLLQEIDLQSLETEISPVFMLLERKEYSTPAWSPDGKWIVFGERCLGDRPTKQLWLVSQEALDGTAITTDVRFNFANYQWHPNSEMLVLQRFEIGSSSARPAILVWHMDTGEMAVVAEDAHTPGWLP